MQYKDVNTKYNKFCSHIIPIDNTVKDKRSLYSNRSNYECLQGALMYPDASKAKMSFKKPELGIRVDIILLSTLINILSLAIPVVLLQVYDRILPSKAFSTATMLFLGATIAILLEGGLRFIRTYLLTLYAEAFECESAVQAMRKIFRCSVASVKNLGSGSLKQRFSDISSLRDHYAGQTSLALIDLPFSVLFLAAIWYIGGTLVFVPLLLFVVAAYSTLYAGTALHKAYKATSEVEDDRMNYVTNILNALTPIKSLGGESMSARIFRDKTQKLVTKRTRLDRLSQQFGAFVALLGSLTTVLTVIVGALLVINGHLTTGGLAACTILAGRSLAPITALLVVWTQVQRTWVAKEHIEDFWKTEEQDVFDAESETTLIDGSIYLENALVTRDKSDVAFSLSVANGEKISFNPSSGLCLPLFTGLMIGTVAPKEGTFLVGGHALSAYNRITYRKSVGYVTRRSEIFRGSILENISLYTPTNERPALELAEDIGLSPFIYSLPNGFQTRVGDMLGGPLEAGTIQRIAIIRALINRPKILILNEADEGIDISGKKQIVNLLNSLTDLTVLIFSTDPIILNNFPHRLSMDEICNIRSKAN